MNNYLKILGLACIASGFAIGFQNCAKPLEGNVDSPSSGTTEIEKEITEILTELPLHLKAEDETATGHLGVSDFASLGDDLVFDARGDEGRHNIRSLAIVPISTGRRYKVSGRFRSAGTVPSIIYFGISCLDGKYQHILHAQAYRRGDAVTVTSVTPRTLGLASEPQGWIQTPNSAYQKFLGFYYDGDTNHLPDFVWDESIDIYSMDPADGPFSSVTGNQVALNFDLPPEVIQRIERNPNTKVMNHYAGAGYVYAATGAISVPETWTNYEGIITGESFNPELIPGGTSQFRPETQFARILILPNYKQQGQGARLLFDDLKFELLP